MATQKISICFAPPQISLTTNRTANKEPYVTTLPPEEKLLHFPEKPQQIKGNCPVGRLSVHEPDAEHLPNEGELQLPPKCAKLAASVVFIATTRPDHSAGDLKVTAPTEQLIRDYYAAFNAGDMDRFLALLTDDVIHDVNQGGREMGRETFRQFMQRMNRCYREQVQELVVMVNTTGERAAAEFVVHGEYLVGDEGLPPARGQKYQLPVGAFFEVRGGRVARVTNYYNLDDWMRQVSE